MKELEWQAQSEQIRSHLELLREMKARGIGREEALSACEAAMEKWGPLAEQLGMNVEQREMLDLAVELGYPEDYKELKQLLVELDAM